MSVEGVINKIIADAYSEARKIKGQAEEKETAERARLQREIDEYKRQTAILAKKAAKDKKMYLLATARMDVSKQYLWEKRRILDDVFQEARKQIEGLPDDKYCQLMKTLMLEAVETGDEEVIVDVDERRIDRQFIRQINTQLGPKGNLKLSEDRRQFGAGFILARGKVKNNVSVEVLLTLAREKLEIDLARELFGCE